MGDMNAMRSLRNLIDRRLLGSVAFLLLASVGLAIFPGQVAAAGRAIAVVYDDWLYANFALQTLIGLLDSEDRLHVVAMSDPGRAVEMTGRTGKSDGIDRLKRQAVPKGNTPEQALFTALQVLQSSPDPSSERWLVVITDGVFDSMERNVPGARRTITDRFARFVRETGARTVLMLIGGGADRSLGDLWKREAQAAVLYAASSREIIDRMHDVASMLSSREAGTADLQATVRGSEETLSPRFPLRRLVVFAQSDGGSQLPRITAMSAAGAELDRVEHLPQMVAAAAGGRSSAIVAHVLAKSAGSVIPEGTDRIRIVFDTSKNVGKVRYLPEVAARLDVELRDVHGRAMSPGKSGAFDVCEGEAVRVVSRLVTPAGKTLTEGQSDPSGFKAIFRLGDGGDQPMALSSSKVEFTGSFQMPVGATTVSAAASFPGYFNFRSRIFTLEPKDCRPRGIRIDEDRSHWKGDVRDLERSHVRLQLLVEGKPPGKEEFSSWTASIVSQSTVPFSLARDESAGVWVLRPKAGWGGACFTPTGDQNPIIQVKSPRPGEDRQVNLVLPVSDPGWLRRCGPFAAAVLASIFLLWWLIGVVRKPRFAKGACVERREAERRSDTSALRGYWVMRYLVPYIPESATSHGLLFRAGRRGDYILLARESQEADMWIAGEKIEVPGQKDVRVSSGTAIQKRGRRPVSFHYRT